MDKKDYEALAAVIASKLRAVELREIVDPRDALYEVATDMAAVFARDNARFDRARFYKACGF